MSKSRQIVLLGSLGLVVLIVAGWFLLLSPRMATAGQINDQRESLEQQNAVTQSTITDLEQKKANIAEVNAQAAELSTRFPATAEESELFTLIRAAAEQAGLPDKAVSDLTAGVPTIGSATGSVTLPEAPAPAEGEAAPADPNAAPAAGTTPSATPTDPTSTAQLANMTLDVTVTASEAEIIRFLEALEEMDRSYLVNTVTLGATEGAGMSATITGSMYLLPELKDPTVETPAAETDETTTEGTEEPTS